jgi:hypothetical protein
VVELREFEPLTPCMPLTSQPFPPQHAHAFLRVNAVQQPYGIEVTQCRLWRHEALLLAACWHVLANERRRLIVPAW